MSMNIEQIAKVAHEINKAYCHAIGDDSHLPWEVAPEWQKSSAINGVKFVMTDPSKTPEQSHENWLKVKEEEGWTYGPVKDVEKKQHPCFVPYSELPTREKVKDSLFRAVVVNLMNIGNSDDNED